MKNTFPARLKELRKKHGLTQQQLADVLGVVRSTVSGYENGTIEPKQHTLTKLADYFQVSFDDLIILDHILDYQIYDNYDVKKHINKVISNIQDLTGNPTINNKSLNMTQRKMVIEMLISVLKVLEISSRD